MSIRLLQSINIPQSINSALTGKKIAFWSTKQEVHEIYRTLEMWLAVSRETGGYQKHQVTCTAPWKVWESEPAACLCSAFHHQEKKHLLSSMAHPDLFDQLRPDVGMTLLSYYSQNLCVSRNIHCYLFLRWEGRYQLVWITPPEISREQERHFRKGLLSLSMSWGQTNCGKHNWTVTSWQTF